MGAANRTNRMKKKNNRERQTEESGVKNGINGSIPHIELLKILSLTMRKRDDRYDLIKSMMRDGKIKSLLDIFKYIPKTVVADDLGKKVDRFNELMNRVDQFTVEELFLMASWCNLSPEEILQLTLVEYRKSKKKITRSKAQSL
jgi:hypothetical protein